MRRLAQTNPQGAQDLVGWGGGAEIILQNKLTIVSNISEHRYNPSVIKRRALNSIWEGSREAKLGIIYFKWSLEEEL